MERTPDLSVVIMPRERLSGLDACIESLAKATDDDTEYIIVNQGYTRKQLRRARQIVAPRTFRVVHDGTFVSEGAARNIGLKAARSPAWVLLVDGEMTVAPDCVTEMRKAAEETGAAMTVPLLLERKGVLHTTGGRFVWPDTPDGKLDHIEGHYQEICPRDHSFTRTELEMVETHIILVDRDQTGIEPFEWEHIHLFHFDVSLTCLKNGWKAIMEPAARAMFNRPPPISWKDYEYFSQRWNRTRFKEDSVYFQQKWGYDVRTENLQDWEDFALTLSLFPENARNRYTQPISNFAWWGRQRLGELRRAWRLRHQGGMVNI